MMTQQNWFATANKLALAPYLLGQKQVYMGLKQYINWLSFLSPPQGQDHLAELDPPTLAIVPNPSATSAVSSTPEQPATLELTPFAQDDLTVISGIGPAIAEKLNVRGIKTWAQIAAWTDADVETLEAEIIRFPGRIIREDWVGQAKALSTQN